MPYAPQTNYTGGDNLYKGFSQLGSNIANYFGGYIEKGEKKKALGEVAMVYTPEGPERDALKKAIPGMSLGELEGHVQGQAIKQKLAEYGQRSKLMDAQIANYQSDNDRLNSQAQDAIRTRQAQSALPAAWQEEANAPSNYVEQNAPRRGYGMESYVAAAGKVGAPIDPHVFATYMQDRGGQPGPADFVEDDVTGSRFLKYGKQVLPSGQNPAKASLKAVTDDAGNVIGYSDNRGRVIQPKADKSTDLTPRDKIRALQTQLGNEFDPAEKARIMKRIDALMGDGVTADGGGASGFGASLFDDFLKSKVKR